MPDGPWAAGCPTASGLAFRANRFNPIITSSTRDELCHRILRTLPGTLDSPPYEGGDIGEVFLGAEERPPLQSPLRKGGRGACWASRFS